MPRALCPCTQCVPAHSCSQSTDATVALRYAYLMQLHSMQSVTAFKALLLPWTLCSLRTS
eukprot:604770-Pelagomonas_calceolata.AAC.1